MMNFRKLEGLRDAEGFVRALETVQTPEELKALLEKHGVELTMEEIGELMAQVQNQGSGELTEEDLDHVVGGARLPGAIVIGGLIYWMLKNGKKWNPLLYPIRKK